MVQLILARWRRVIDDDHGLRLFACQNESNNPTEKRDAEKDIENDNSRRVRTISLYCHNGGKEIKSQYAK